MSTSTKKKAGHLRQQVPAVVPTDEEKNTMSVTRDIRAVQQAAVEASCMVCGAGRTTMMRRRSMHLRCANCSCTTWHLALIPGQDFRERENAKAAAGIAELLALAARLEAIRDVEVHFRDIPHVAHVRRYLDGSLMLTVARTMTIEAQKKWLHRAWEWVAENDFTGRPILKDARGDQYQELHGLAHAIDYEPRP